MPRHSLNQIPSERRISMHRYLTGEIKNHLAIRDIALHVGLKEEQVREYLEYLRKSKQITPKSPFHKKLV